MIQLFCRCLFLLYALVFLNLLPASADPFKSVGLPKATSLTSQKRYFLTNSDVDFLECMHVQFSALGQPSDLLNSYGTWLETNSPEFAAAINSTASQCAENWSQAIFSQESLIYYFLRGIVLRNFKTGDPHRKEAVFAIKMRGRYLDDFFKTHWADNDLEEEFFLFDVADLTGQLESESFPEQVLPMIFDFALSRAYYTEDYESIERLINIGALSQAACLTKHKPIKRISLPCFSSYLFYTEPKGRQIFDLLTDNQQELVVFVVRDHLVDHYNYKEEFKIKFINKAERFQCAFDKVIRPNITRINEISKRYRMTDHEAKFAIAYWLSANYEGFDISAELLLDTYASDLKRVPATRLTSAFQYIVQGQWKAAKYGDIFDNNIVQLIQDRTDSIIAGAKAELEAGTAFSYKENPRYKFRQNPEIKRIIELTRDQRERCKSDLSSLDILDRLIEDDFFNELYTPVWKYGKSQSFDFAMMPRADLLKFFEVHPFDYWQALAPN